MFLRSFVVLAALASVVTADEVPRFDVARMKLDGNVLSVVPADLDGDGKVDLLAVYQHGSAVEPPRYIGVFWNQGGSFSVKPDLVLRVDDRACAFDVAELDEVPGAELVTIGREGVWSTRFSHRKADGPTLVVGDATVFYRPDPKQLPRLPLVHELGRGVRRLVVPLLGAVGIYTRAGAPVARVDIDEKSTISLDDHVNRPRSSLFSFGLSFVFPAVHFMDFDGDGLADLVVTLEDRLTVFRQRAGGTFDATPAYKRNFGVRTAAEAARAVQGVSMSVADFDGDGIADLVIGKLTGKGLTSATTTSYLYVGKRGGGYASDPDQTLRVDGASDGDGFEPMDLTGDGKPDLIVPTVTMGVWAIIRMLTTKMVNVKFQVFSFGADHRFVETPITRELKFKISLSGEADLPAVEMHGDYNGDRKPDLAFGINDGELGIFTGVGADGIVTKDPVDRIKIEARGRLHAVDLDHRGKDDIVLHYPSTERHRDEIVVLRNRGSW